MGELDDALDIVFRHHRRTRGADGLSQRQIALRIEAILLGDARLVAGADNGVQMGIAELGAGNQGGDFLLLDSLPANEFLDVGMIDVEADHFRGAPRRAARLDCARGPVADAQKTHQTRRTTAARQRLVLGPQRREVASRARPVFEQPRLADPQVHDARIAHQIVFHGLDEAGMRLGMFVGRLGTGQFAGPVVDVVMALAGAVDAVSPVKSGVKPLRRVRRRHLVRDHVAHFVEERPGILLGVEESGLPAPVGPGSGETVEDLRGAHFAAVALVLGVLRQRLLVRNATLQPIRNVLFLDLANTLRHARLAKVFLGKHVARDLTPRFRHFDFVELEYDRPVRIANLAVRQAERHVCVGGFLRFCEMPLDAHPGCLPKLCCCRAGALRVHPGPHHDLSRSQKMLHCLRLETRALDIEDSLYPPNRLPNLPRRHARLQKAPQDLDSKKMLATIY